MMSKKEAQAIILQPGLYRHYKGGEYEVISVARHSETGEQLVVYRCLYDDGSWWVRPLEMFAESVEVDGNIVPRFSFVSDHKASTE
jgi:hypothetical protein